MTDTQAPDDVVTEADRNLFKLIITGMVGPARHNAIDSGGFDNDDRMQAIARHRTQDTLSREGREALLTDHFPTGLRSEYPRTAQGIPVPDLGVVVDCTCGHRIVGTDEQEARQLWAVHASAALSTAPPEQPLDTIQRLGQEMEQADQYVIIKNGMYYRPNAQGYTSSIAEAGRYTLDEAIRHSHPNGPRGPRDGMSYRPVVSDAPEQADQADLLREALGRLEVLSYHSGYDGRGDYVWEDVVRLADIRAILSTQSAMQSRIEELEAAVNDSQATLLAIKADCAARIECEEDQMASHIVDICQQTMLSNRATLSNIGGSNDG